jgi:2-polyprenyl-3-methyl-5-hydroxy-6-metoxy-1,4-benzoquinol methylase
MDYREKLYSTYVSTHTAHLYGEATLEGIRKQFPVWKSYYGRFLPRDKAAKILDIGCGNGGFLWWLQQIGYRNSSGIDISQEQIQIARGLGIKNVKCADLIGFLESKQGYYDVIFLMDVIEHFNKNEILGILKLTFDSLNSGGEVIIQTPNGESLFSGRLRYGDFTHEVIFTKSSLNQILQAAGFKDTEFYPTEPVPKGLKSAVRYLLWKGIETILKFYVAIETGSFSGIFTQNIIALGKK